MTAPRQRIAAAALLAVVFALLFALRGSLRADLPVDFRAFYCSGEAANAGADPYRVEPLRSCENRLASGDEARAIVPGLVVPSPLPAYDLALLRLLARTDFESAYELFILTCIVLFGATLAALQALTRRPLLALLAVLLVGDLYLSLLLGQIAGIATALATLCALALSRERYALAGALAALTCIEPHLGLPAVLGIALFAPRARSALAIALGALCAVSPVAIPLAESREYLLTILAEHVRAETVSHEQLSVTHLLWLAHASPEVAAKAGSLSYLVMLAFGLFSASRLCRGPSDPLVVLLPFGLAPIGGAFIHVTQVCATLPLLTIVAASDDRARTYRVALAIALLAVPWIAIAGSAEPAANTAFAVAAALGAAIGIAKLRPLPAIGLATLSAALSLVLHAIGTPVAHGPALAAALEAVDPRASAETVWRIFNEQSRILYVPQYLAARAPTWIGSLAALGVVLGMLREDRVRKRGPAPADGRYQTV